MFKTIAAIALAYSLFSGATSSSSVPINSFVATPAFHIHGDRFGDNRRGNTPPPQPTGLSPAMIKSIYNLPPSGGSGTIAIIDAYADPYVQNDLATFDTQYQLATCTTNNGCLTIHAMANRLQENSGWALENSLDTQWAHAIAPTAKILLVEARSSSGNDLLNAINYARGTKGVTSVSMSWGGTEFSGENAYDSYFTTNNGSPITFFAASGDSGTGVEWPAVSTNVTGVGGTTLTFTSGVFSSETAWDGSGGGISQFESEPSYQTTHGITDGNKRTVPDVSFDADPASGVSVYDSLSYNGQSGWWQIGGTSIGAPSWAAIKALGNGSNTTYYPDETSSPTDFRDILTGTNGTCGLVCSAGAGYDYVTGLGSPLITTF
jgi:subtilase family serine protease